MLFERLSPIELTELNQFNVPPTKRHSSHEILDGLEVLTKSIVGTLITPSPRPSSKDDFITPTTPILPIASTTPIAPIAPTTPVTPIASIVPSELSYFSSHTKTGSILPKGTTYVIYKNRLCILTDKPRDHDKPIGVLRSERSGFCTTRAGNFKKKVNYQAGLYHLYEYRL